MSIKNITNLKYSQNYTFSMTKRDVKITVRLSKKEYDYIKKMAEHLMMKIPEYFRFEAIYKKIGGGESA